MITEKLPNEDYNARRFIWANGLQSIGDQVVAAKTVLPWILAASGTPSFYAAMLVPIRESGSMLPQAALTPWVVRQPSRKLVWVWGSIVQAVAAAGIGIAALLTTGHALGLATIILLSILAGGRALCSIASKDVQGRTIAKGRRGTITGTATMVGGISVVAIGVFLMFLGKQPPIPILVGLIILSALAWLVAGLIFKTIDEPGDEPKEEAPNNWIKDSWELLATDRQFRTFVIVRSLLLVSALSPTFVVMLAPSGLGSFLLASGVAAIIGGRISGVWSDKSSKSVMTVGSLVASAILIGLVVCDQFASQTVNNWIMPVGFFGIHLVHTAIRVARKTYVVDMAEGATRTRYVAVANTVLGVVLLFAGLISGGISHFGPDAALLFLAGMGIVGTVWGRKLVDVSR
ncbi:hypothetical protein [Corynebacterium epidermidicanis]|uniref:Major Facilitator Superfamily transporter n=1 Tax=Corynebacterium epidermidicanis TaxID=1050174 RepID=A0A0G3GV66_9CORY|nr:hypothetical protein [Corynebacterium epidermidicanis]AKK02722.1 hypothetical protein CEPID_04245 [Corynebacterium epidermidicanis]